ncbi:MAG: EamA family transporter, partial [Desulfobacterales bacterium]
MSFFSIGVYDRREYRQAAGRCQIGRYFLTLGYHSTMVLFSTVATIAPAGQIRADSPHGHAMSQSQNREHGVKEETAGDHRPPPESPAGAACAVAAFLIWGLTPIYFKTLRFVPALEILMHRMVWSFLFLLPFVVFTQRRHEFVSVISSGRTLMILLVTTILVSSNWF